MVRHLWQLFNYQFNSMKTAPDIKQLPHLYQDCLQDLLAMNIYLCNKTREITDNVLAVAFEIPLFNSYTSCLINWPNPLKFRKTTEKKKNGLQEVGLPAAKVLVAGRQLSLQISEENHASKGKRQLSWFCLHLPWYSAYVPVLANSKRLSQ